MINIKVLGSEDGSGWNFLRIMHTSKFEYLPATIRDIFSY
jgi:hypothetical protein